MQCTVYRIRPCCAGGNRWDSGCMQRPIWISILCRTTVIKWAAIGNYLVNVIQCAFLMTGSCQQATASISFGVSKLYSVVWWCSLLGVDGRLSKHDSWKWRMSTKSTSSTLHICGFIQDHSSSGWNAIPYTHEYKRLILFYCKTNSLNRDIVIKTTIAM